MSLGLVIKVSEGLVLAADSRIVIAPSNVQGVAQVQGAYDNITTKLFSFEPPHNFIGAVSFGQPVLGNRTVSAYVIEFKEYLREQLPERLSVYDFATELSEFFTTQWDALQIPPLGVQLPFLVAGYDDKTATGRIYGVNIPESIEPAELMSGSVCGIIPEGDARIIGRILAGYDVARTDVIRDLTEEQMLELRLPIPYDVMSLQAAVDLAIVLIRVTIDLQNLSVMPHTSGGPIDVCTISNTDGLKYIQRKEIIGEY